MPIADFQLGVLLSALTTVPLPDGLGHLLSDPDAVPVKPFIAVVTPDHEAVDVWFAADAVDGRILPILGLAVLPGVWRLWI